MSRVMPKQDTGQRWQRMYEDYTRVWRVNYRGNSLESVLVSSARYNPVCHDWEYTLTDPEGKRIEGVTKERDLKGFAESFFSSRRNIPAKAEEQRKLATTKQIDDAESDSSETASIASSFWSNSTSTTVASFDSDTMDAASEAVIEAFMGDLELCNLFTKAFTNYDREKVLRNGVRLLKWFGRRLLAVANTPTHREAARFFLSRRHDRIIMHGLAEGMEGQILDEEQRKSRSSKLVKLETHLQRQLPGDVESEPSSDSEEEQESTSPLHVDSVKKYLTSSHAFARLKEELSDFVSPFTNESMWMKKLWIGEVPIHFELPSMISKPTRLDDIKLAMEHRSTLRIIWWPLKQPRRLLAPSRIRMLLKTCHKSVHSPEKKVVKCGCEKKEILPKHNEQNEWSYRIDPDFLDEDDHVSLAEQALIHYYHGYEKCFATDRFDNLLLGIPHRINGAEIRFKGYGIWAKQGWTLPKLAGFVLITQGWAMLFVIYWLCRHPGDIQNAFVPALYSLALVTVFVAIPDVFRT
ncbi:MAG: hypothetical protein Q9170_008205 [Blastenia crenularia]